MADRDDDADPKDDLKQGLGHLWSAARKAAGSLRKDLDRSSVGKALDDATREIARAGNHVMRRVGDELKKVAGDDPKYGDAKNPPDPFTPERPDDPTGTGAKPKGPTPDDPGFSIANDDPDKPR